MNEALQTTLKKLRLSGMAQSLDVRLQEAGGNGLNHAEFLELVAELKELRKTRRDFIGQMIEADFDVIIDAERIRGVERIPAGILLLDMLDHERHHRGQIALALSLYESAGGTIGAPSVAADLTRF